MTNREEMIAEATDLGLEFKGNISNISLAAMLAKFKGEPPPVDEALPESPTVKVTSEVDENENKNMTASQQRVHSDYVKKRLKITAAKKRAQKTRVVTITNKDPRENDVATTAFLSFENQHFGIAKNVPLDIPVELELPLIAIAEKCMMTMHRDEIKNGRRTGNKVTGRVKKYAVSYGSQQPKD